MTRELSQTITDSPFACPACHVGLGLPRQVAAPSGDLWPVGLRCHRCGHEWSLGPDALARASAPPPPPTRATLSTIQPITACRHCARLMTLDVALDTGLAPQASPYVCPHCGAGSEVMLPGAAVKAVAAA